MFKFDPFRIPNSENSYQEEEEEEDEKVSNVFPSPGITHRCVLKNNNHIPKAHPTVPHWLKLLYHSLLKNQMTLRKLLIRNLNLSFVSLWLRDDFYLQWYCCDFLSRESRDNSVIRDLIGGRLEKFSSRTK